MDALEILIGEIFLITALLLRFMGSSFERFLDYAFNGTTISSATFNIKLIYKKTTLYESSFSNKTIINISFDDGLL